MHAPRPLGAPKDGSVAKFRALGNRRAIMILTIANRAWPHGTSRASCASREACGPASYYGHRIAGAQKVEACQASERGAPRTSEERMRMQQQGKRRRIAIGPPHTDLCPGAKGPTKAAKIMREKAPVADSPQTRPSPTPLVALRHESFPEARPQDVPKSSARPLATPRLRRKSAFFAGRAQRPRGLTGERGRQRRPRTGTHVAGGVGGRARWLAGERHARPASAALSAPLRAQDL